MSKSIVYFTRSSILFDESTPLTVSELKYFLDRLIMGGYGGFRVFDEKKGVTHYTLDDRKNTVVLD